MYKVGLWKAIRTLGEFINSRVSFSIGNGGRVKFWKDIWCREELLRVAFPSLFVIASLKEAWVVDLWTQSRGKGVWFRSFSRHLNDLKIEGLECFLSRLQDKVVIGDREDNIIWLETKMELSLLSHFSLF